jgi:uncharacterized protein YlxW (UPF0749 family)
MRKKALDIWKWITNLGNLVKVVISLVTLAGLVIGGIKGYNKSVENKYQTRLREASKEVKLDKALVYLDSINSSVKELNTLVNEHTNKLNQLDRKQDVMKGIMTKEFAKTMTPAQVLDMMEQFEIKKNESYFNEIQLGQSPLWIPYSFRSELEK